MTKGDTTQGHSKRSGWLGFGRTTISHGKNKIPFYKKQIINKSTRVIFGLLYCNTVDRKAYNEIENN